MLINIERPQFESQNHYLQSMILSPNQIMMIKDEIAKVMEEFVNKQLLDQNDVISYARFQGDCQGQLKILNMLLEYHINATEQLNTQQINNQQGN